MAYYSMLYADYILRIRIVGIDSMLNKNSSLNYFRYKAASEVLDTLKGKVIPTSEESLKTIKNNVYFQQPFLNFQFSMYNYGMFSVSGKDPLYFTVDKMYLYDGWKFKMSIGDEAIIFIRFQNPIFDFQNDYFDLDLEQRCSLNALRIENGNVYDINNIWSPQTVIPYDNWKQIYNNLKANILNTSY